MKILLAVLLPPLAVLLCGKPLAALLTIPLTMLAWFPGMVYAIYVVMNHDADARVERLATAMGKANQAKA